MLIVSMSSRGSTLPSTCTTSGSLNARITWQIASASRMFARNLLPSPAPSLAPLDDAGDVDERHGRRDDLRGVEQLRQDVQARIGHADDADVGIDGRERVVGRQHVVLRQRVEQCGLADVGQPDDPDGETHGLNSRWLPETVGPVCHHRSMNVLLIMLLVALALTAGIGLGYALASRRRDEVLLHDGSMAAMVAPLRDSLANVGHHLGEVEKGRAVSDAALREQVRAMAMTSELLRTQTTNLVTALRAPQVRGRWGEMQLERIVEAAGLTEHVDYVTQESVHCRRHAGCDPTWSCA